MKNRKIIDIIKYSLIIITLIVIILPIIISAGFSVFSADDFSMANSAYYSMDKGLFFSAARVAYSLYTNWTGIYIVSFLAALLNPLLGYGFVQLRAILIVMAITFFLIYLLCCVLLAKKVFGFRVSTGLLITALMLFALIEYRSYTEIFYWFTGAIAYLLPVIFFLIAIIFVLVANTKSQKRYTIFAILFGFIANGGAMMVAGISCYCMLLFLIYSLLTESKKIKVNLYIFISWVISGLIASLAPGNFSRRNIIDGNDANFFRAIYDAIRMESYRIEHFFGNTNFIAILLLIIFISYYSSTNINFKKNKILILLLVFSLVAPAVGAFPLALGYGSQDTPIRCKFVMDIAFVTIMGGIAAYIGILLRKFIKKINIYLAISLVLISFICSNYEINDMTSIKIMQEIIDGSYKEYSEKTEILIENLSNSPKGTDYIVESEELGDGIDNIYLFYLSEDHKDWVNKAVAKWYNLNSVVLRSTE